MRTSSMRKITNNYTHQQVEALYHALEQAVNIAAKTFEADCRLANDINNTDGVGIHFDYYNAAPLPAWTTTARIAMEPFRS